MWALIEKLLNISTYTITTAGTATVADSTTVVYGSVNSVAANTTDYICKLVEVRNTSTTMSIKVYPNKVGFITLLPLERRVFMVKKLSDLTFTLVTGTTSTVIELAMEN